MQIWPFVVDDAGLVQTQRKEIPMANKITYTRDSAGDYQTRFNKRELKVLETALTDSNQYGVSSLAAAAADYAITDVDGYSTFVVNDAITITMPAAATNVGRILTFSLVAAAVLTIAQNADDANIGGADADYTTLDAAGDSAQFVCNGAQWVLIGSTIA